MRIARENAALAQAGAGGGNDYDEEVELLSVNWNQDHICFNAAATTTGFRIFSSEPFKETIRRAQPNYGFGIVEMLFRTSNLGFVGGGYGAEYPRNKVERSGTTTRTPASASSRSSPIS